MENLRYMSEGAVNRGEDRRRGGVLGGAVVAPLVAAVLALVAAGLLITFSLWAQNVVSESGDETQVGPKKAHPRAGAVVLQAGAQTKPHATSGKKQPNDQAVALEVINSQSEFEPSATKDPGKKPDKAPHKDHKGDKADGPVVLAGGHIGGPFPHGPGVVVDRPGEQPGVFKEEACPPRRVHGAPKVERRVPPGHCKHGEADGVHTPGHGKKDEKHGPWAHVVGSAKNHGHEGKGHSKGSQVAVAAVGGASKPGKSHGSHGLALGHSKGGKHKDEYTQGHRFGGPDKDAVAALSHGKGHSKASHSKSSRSKSHPSKGQSKSHGKHGH
jgi:hypothetical protein